MDPHEARGARREVDDALGDRREIDDAPRVTEYSIPLSRIAEAHGIALDERGLFPLETARRLVGSTRVYERDGDPPGDVLWAALLSLEDGAELAREGARLEWRFPYLRGWDNEDAVRRYGAEALPWLEAMLARTGTFGSIPAEPFYFVGTHLLAIGPEAVSAILRARRTGDADPDGLDMLTLWLKRHGKPAWVALGELASRGDSEAKRAVDALAMRSPTSVRRQLGEELAKRVLGPATGAPSLTSAPILAVLDAAAASEIHARMPWPALVAQAPHFEFHALRVVVARAKKGDDWGVLVEVVQGDEIDHDEEVRWPATIQHYTYGTKVETGGAYLFDARPIPRTLVPEPVDEETCARLDLRPSQSITQGIADWKSVLTLRRTLVTTPELLFPPAAKVVRALGLRSPEILLDVRALEHVDGTRYGADDRKRLPSASPSWRSIAEVIVTRDPSRFDPGTPNTDWRSMLRFGTPSA